MPPAVAYDYDGQAKHILGRKFRNDKSSFNGFRKRRVLTSRYGTGEAFVFSANKESVGAFAFL
jgi:hypothetical protein